MKVVWTLPADEDRNQIALFIAKDNPDTAIDMDDLIGGEVQNLALSPFKGRHGRVHGTREWMIHKSYVLVYQYDVESSVVYILAVLHTARQWPPVSMD